MALIRLVGKKYFRDINFIISFTCVFYILFLAIYYGLQEQVDFRVFWTAGKEWNEGNNPYLRENQGNPSHPLLNAPTSLLLYGILGKFDLQVAAVLYRLLCVGLLLMLTVFVSRKLNMSFYFIFPFIALSTPFRTNLGSGQVSLLAAIAFIYIVLSIYKDQKLNKAAVIFSLFVILSFKAYMFPAAILLLFLRKRIYLVLLGLGTFAFGLVILELRVNIIDSWLENTSRIGAVAINEANNSSIISIVSRLTNNLSFAVIVFLFINTTLFVFLIKDRNEMSIFSNILLFGLISSIYVHHQDYLLALIALIILLSSKAQTNSKIIDFFHVGLQPNSLFLHIVTFSLRVLQFHKIRPRSYAWYPIIFSGATAFYWYQGNIYTSFLIYDLVYMATVFLILVKIYKMRSSVIIS